MKILTLSLLLFGFARAESGDPTRPMDPRLQEALRTLQEREATPAGRGPAAVTATDPQVHLRGRTRQGDRALVLLSIDGETVLLQAGDAFRHRQHRVELIAYDETGVRVRINGSERSLR